MIQFAAIVSLVLGLLSTIVILDRYKQRLMSFGVSAHARDRRIETLAYILHRSLIASVETSSTVSPIALVRWLEREFPDLDTYIQDQED